uniref:Uncharacterized protein n=1 Tax=Avena sativa TaxID=4498 RepID=A0ACD5T6P8_AVESA
MTCTPDQEKPPSEGAIYISQRKANVRTPSIVARHDTPSSLSINQVRSQPSIDREEGRGRASRHDAAVPGDGGHDGGGGAGAADAAHRPGRAPALRGPGRALLLRPPRLRARVSSRHTVDAEGLAPNHLYHAVRAYLAARAASDAAVRRHRASRLDDSSSHIALTIDHGEETVDVHDGVAYTWRLLSRDPANAKSTNACRGGGQQLHVRLRSFELTFHKKHKDKAISAYLPFVEATAKSIKDQQRNLKMHMIEYDAWTAVDLRHPSTFDTLAMDAALKKSVVDDLERFVKRKDYYRRTGRAWKRGYLLYGPPGTGKSSLVAAMANYLKFDIYDLELTEVKSNSDLRRLLVGMSNRSILVVEDIDCSQRLGDHHGHAPNSRRGGFTGGDDSNNEDKVTLFGLLNFVDGLWSTSGEERIIVFTTNYKERLDPALLRPGRMDMHIHMGYCTPESFRILATNYHSVNDHAMFSEIESLLQEVPITPAEVAEVLMRNDGAEDALQDLVEFIKAKRDRSDDEGVAARNQAAGKSKVEKYEQLVVE